MNHLFTTDIETNGKMETFEVTFSNDNYHFNGLNSNTQFDLRREEDEWHSSLDIEDSLKNAAIAKLDAYLLSQH